VNTLINTRLLRMEFRLYFRDIAAVIFGILLSPLILVILGSIPAFREPNPDIGGQTVIALYVPIMLAMAIAMVAVSTMPVVLATYRERGILRRLETTPVRPRDLLVAQTSAQFTVLVIGAVLVIAIGRAAFGVELPGNPVAYVLSFLLCAASLFGLGVLLAGVGSGKVAQGLGSVFFFPMMFFAGLWVPREVMPEVLRGIGDYTPLGAGVQALQDAAEGHWPQLLHVAVMLGYTILTWSLAARYFRWS
jgi:ABC-2 type transport system permease protein